MRADKHKYTLQWHKQTLLEPLKYGTKGQNNY